MYRSWRACVEEFEGARVSVGDLGALCYVTALIVVTLVGMVIVLILGALLLALLPLALVVALAALCASRSERASPDAVKPPSPDPWLSE